MIIIIGLFILNLTLTVLITFGFFGDARFTIGILVIAIIALSYVPLMNRLRQPEIAYIKGLGSLLFALSLSQLLGFLIYAIASGAFVNKDYTALVICSGMFATSLVALIFLYSASYWVCRKLGNG
jgi:hypothetical protein